MEPEARIRKEVSKDFARFGDRVIAWISCFDKITVTTVPLMVNARLEFAVFPPVNTTFSDSWLLIMTEDKSKVAGITGSSKVKVKDSLFMSRTKERGCGGRISPKKLLALKAEEFEIFVKLLELISKKPPKPTLM